MKALKMVLVTIGIGIGGGALWIGVKPSKAVAACAICDRGKCITGTVDSTCDRDCSGPGPCACVSSSGCVFL